VKKILAIIGVSLVLVQAREDAEVKYAVSEIPAELLEGVNVVVREDHMVFKINSISNATYRNHSVVTILNEKGKRYASETVDYSKLIRITDFNATVYDALGKPIKRLKNSEIIDQSAFDGFTLFSDQRLKHADLSQQTYPYTVEFEYEMELKYLYGIPGTTIGGEKISVQKASYQLIYPAALMPRYLALNISQAPLKQTLTNGNESVTWKFENVKPVSFEPIGPRQSELLPHIMAAPSKFEYEGYVGNMETWKEYGRWSHQLAVGRSELPPATKQKVKELTKNLTTPEEKAKVLYQFLQNKTRYVGIQEGIGGLQPFPASVVDETGYGDCKALSNYMVALLAEAGIKGYYTHIRAGENEPEVVLAFPSHQSNHAIVGVPLVNDTVWMECTSQSKPFGYMGKFTGDRYALMITEDGGKIVRTPAYKAEQNRQTRRAKVVVDGQGNAKANVRTMYSGIQFENGGLSELLDNQYDEQKKWVQNYTEIPNFQINTYSMSGIKTKIPVAIVNLDLALPRYASVSGKRLFLSPNLMNKSRYVPEKIESRKTDVVLRSNYLDVDTVNFQFPENLYPEFLPQPVKVSSRFGEYEASFQFSEGSLIYIRKMKVSKGRFPKEAYNEYVEFYKNINKADNIKLVFLSKT
jgi:hypothetical protein